MSEPDDSDSLSEICFSLCRQLFAVEASSHAIKYKQCMKLDMKNLSFIVPGTGV